MKTVVIGMLGTNLDRRGRGKKRWNSWRPTVSLCQHDDLIVDRLELICPQQIDRLAEVVASDIHDLSPETQVNIHAVEQSDPWEFSSVYASLRLFADNYPFDPENERYLVHMTTGTHVAQICWFLLTEARYIPGNLIQTSPPSKHPEEGELPIGSYQIIDLDLSQYDQIAQRFRQEHLEGTAYLKRGIQTRNKAFNAMIEQLEKVSIKSSEPILLTGPTGAGKSQLAQQIYKLKKQRTQIDGNFVSVNCATLRGDSLSSALFGHIKGAFTGAHTERKGLLRQAHNGLLFLDEIGELGLEEQAMLLSAIETKRFFPFGSDQETSSNFRLIAGTNRDLLRMVQKGSFREDLLARLDLWSYELPSLKQRIEDFEPNLDYEIDKARQRMGTMVRFSREARQRYLSFATNEAEWLANFRDLNSSVTRMTTLAEGGRLSEEIVENEIKVLKRRWRMGGKQCQLSQYLSEAEIEQIDHFDRSQLEAVINTCQRSQSMAEAGRKLFQASRARKTTHNDSHRVKQYLAKFNLNFDQIKERG